MEKQTSLLLPVLVIDD